MYFFITISIVQTVHLGLNFKSFYQGGLPYNCLIVYVADVSYSVDGP